MCPSECHSAISRRAVLLGGLAAVSACARQRLTPPLIQLYAGIDQRSRKTPLVLVPGAFSTRLRRRSTGEEIWPRTPFALATSNYSDIGLQIDPHTLDPLPADTETNGLFLDVLGQDFYRSLLQTLESAGGYSLGSSTDPGPTPGRVCYVYEYDWRQDVSINARGLHALIELIAEAHGDPEQQVDILAHSSGGLVARYYARYGEIDALDDSAIKPNFSGSRRIRRLLLVATPNSGTIQAVLSHVRGEDIGLRYIPAEVVATCPGALQIMPHPEHHCLLDMHGNALPFDLYNIESWREMGISVFNDEVSRRIRRRHGNSRSADEYLELLSAFLARHLARGKRLHSLLSAPPDATEPRPYLFGSDCTPTLSRIVVSESRHGYDFHEKLRGLPHGHTAVDFESLMYEPGDSVVTRSSLMGQPLFGRVIESASLHSTHSLFLCAPHRTFMSNADFQNNLLHTLTLTRDEGFPE